MRCERYGLSKQAAYTFGTSYRNYVCHSILQSLLMKQQLKLTCHDLYRSRIASNFSKPA